MGSRKGRTESYQDVVPFEDVGKQIVFGLLGKGTRAPHQKYITDPIAYCYDILGVTLFDYHSEVADSIVHNKRTLWHDGHGVGKTFFNACLLQWWIDSHPNSISLSTGPNYDQVKSKLWEQLRLLRMNARGKISGKIQPEAPYMRAGPKWYAAGISTKEPERFHGGHAEHVLILFMEAQGVTEKIWVAGEAMMVGDGRRWYAEGNPTESSGPFYSAYRKRDLWNCFSYGIERHPNIIAAKEGKPIVIPEGPTLEWVLERKKDWGENDPRYMSRVLGKFPEGAEDRLITIGMLEEAERSFCPVADGMHAALDVARFGSDENIFVLFLNRKLITLKRWGGQDTIETAKRLIDLIEEYEIDPENVSVDVIGIGAGVVDYCHENACYVQECNFSEEPHEDWPETVVDTKIRNRRAELYWVCRQLLREHVLCIPEEEFGEVWEDLIEPTYFYDNKERIQLEPKDKIKARLGRSPDCGDAAVMALSRSVPLRI